MNERTFVELAAAELASVVGALVGAEGQAVATREPGAWERVIRLVFAGKVSGTITFAIDAAGASSLSRQVMGLDEDPPEPSVIDTLKEVYGQAIGALAQQGELQGLRVSETHLESSVPQSAATSFTISAEDRFSATVGMWALLDITSHRAAAPVEDAPPAPGPSPANLDVILDIDLPLSVRFGETEMTLQRLTRLAPGSVIDLGRSPDDPVDVLVNGRLIARGEVVVVGGNYGVRVTEVISATDRWRSVAG